MDSGTLRAWVSDVKLILQKSKISKDSRIYDTHLADLVNKYRAIGIRQTYQKTFDIDPAWLQNLGLIDFTEINSGEDPTIKCTSLKLGKATIPQLVSLPDDVALGNVFFPSKLSEWYRVDYNFFYSIPEGSDRSKFNYVFRIGNAIYCSPPQPKGTIIAILDNPMEGFVIQSENQLTLVPGNLYIVKSGTIVVGPNTYSEGNTFIAAQETFTGTGTVQFANGKRKMTWDDVYPMSRTMGEFVCMKILTNEFGIEPRQIADIENDSQDQLALIQPTKIAASERQTVQSRE